MNMSKRAQTATEYLIILAVVVVIALIVVGVLGGIPGIGGGAGAGALDAYWKTNGKIGVDAMSISGTQGNVDTLTIRNLQPGTITVAVVALNVSNVLQQNATVFTGTVTIPAGQSYTFKSGTSASTTYSKFTQGLCVAGEKFTVYLKVNYTVVATGAGYTFLGEGNKLEGTCAN